MGRYLEIAKKVGPASTPPPDEQEGRPWPPECVDSEQRFGGRFARLLPLLNKEVWTPQGRGVLLQVFRDRAAVVMPGAEMMTFISPEEILPLV